MATMHVTLKNLGLGGRSSREVFSALFDWFLLVVAGNKALNLKESERDVQPWKGEEMG